jgi:outer membrane biosynthesis protein TonB
MSTYLAAILGLCAWTTPSFAAVAFPAQPLQLSQETEPPTATPSAPTQDSPQNTAPSAQPTTPPPSEPPTTPVPEATQEPQTAKPEPAVKKPEPQTKAVTKKRRRRKTAASASTAAPEKKVVRNGGTTDPAVQLAPGMSPEQASNQRQNTTQLLAATDANLKQISSRPINPSQQASVSQIRKYMEQAKDAEQAGDVQRAENLASKALLLSDDLAKQ